MSTSNNLYLEDFSAGQVFRGTQTLTVTAEAIKAFAAQFDPQPFHLDEEAAKTTFFRGLAASGWHTAAMTMKLLVESDFKPAGGLIGAGAEEFAWPRPTRPGDVLSISCEILEVRPSAKNPHQGMLRIRMSTFNGAMEPVQVAVRKIVVQRRPAAG